MLIEPASQLTCALNHEGAFLARSQGKNARSAPCSLPYIWCGCSQARTDMNNDLVIEANALNKSFGDKHVVRDFSMQVIDPVLVAQPVANHDDPYAVRIVDT